MGETLGADVLDTKEAIKSEEWRDETEKWADVARQFLNNYREKHPRFNDRVDFSNPSDTLDKFLKEGADPGRISVMYEDDKPVRMTISVSPSNIHIWGDAMEALVAFSQENEAS
ncbi:MAG: hypothetical protein WC773_00025 [Patescibacteria group bacterium]|jgi:hypothetical protein